MQDIASASQSDLLTVCLSIPDKSWRGRLSRRREVNRAEDVSAHKPVACWTVSEFKRDTSSAN
jgi:hypothetical protein